MQRSQRLVELILEKCNGQADRMFLAKNGMNEGILSGCRRAFALAYAIILRWRVKDSYSLACIDVKRWRQLRQRIFHVVRKSKMTAKWPA